jgi:PAS domain S-box-containing protein
MLLENEEQLQLALLAGQMGTWDWDVRTGAVSWSPNLEAIHGLPTGSFKGTFAAVVEEIHPDDRAGVIQTITRTLEEGSEHHVEYRILWPDGSVHWLEGRGRIFHDAGGQPERMLGVCMDVTERKKAELALVESEQRYRRLLASVTDYICTVKLDRGRPVETKHGPGCEPVTGYPPESFTADPYLWYRMIAPEDRDAVMIQVRRVLIGEDIPSFEHRIIHRDGSIRWISNTAVLYRDEQGRVTAYDGLIRDITPRKQIEETLQRHHSLLHSIIEGTTDAIFVKDRQGRYLMINSAGARLLGKRVEEVIGNDDTALFSPDTARSIMDGDSRVMATGEVQTYEDVGTAAGVTRTFLSTKGPYRDAAGNIIGLIGISHDITERKLAEKRMLAEHAVTRVLADSVNLQEATPRLFQTICEGLGWDVAILWQVDRSANVLRCSDIWHMPGVEVPGFEQLSRELTFPRGQGLPGRVWASGEPAWIASTVEDATFLRHRIAQMENLRAALAFPIRGSKEYQGVLEVFSREPRWRDEVMLATMASISSQISQFIEHRQAEKSLHQREYELGLARQIQQGLLPRTTPVIAGFAIGSGSQPAQETGGDYFDFLTLADGRPGIAIGDASGHGISAALLMADTRAYLRALTTTQADVGRIVSLVNEYLVQDIERDWFVTLFLASLDPNTRTMTYCSAGHCDAWILDRKGDRRTLLRGGIPLGIDPAFEYTAPPPVQLDPGDIVFLFTDGILGGRSPDAVFSIDEALSLIHQHRETPASAIVQAVLQEVCRRCGEVAFDDRTVVILKVDDCGEQGA